LCKAGVVTRWLTADATDDKFPLLAATFTRRGAMSEVHSEADVSRIADPAALIEYTA